MFEIIAQDAVALPEFEHDEPDSMEKQKMKRRLGVDMLQLLGYKYLSVQAIYMV